PRNAPMFGPGGRAYVYRSYGLHWCMNVTCGLVGHGAAVLLRALQPLQGDALMLRRRLQPLRNKQPPATAYVARRLAVGPGNLCVAMAVASHHNDADLLRGPLRIVCDPKRVRGEVVATTRVGISIAQEVPWRFLLANNPHVSKAPSPARAS
ncbi:MAG: DNA-3-methyladenine glycosylase, partial [Deltaproteobacteria bacterium]